MSDKTAIVVIILAFMTMLTIVSVFEILAKGCM